MASLAAPIADVGGKKDDDEEEKPKAKKKKKKKKTPTPDSDEDEAPAAPPPLPPAHRQGGGLVGGLLGGLLGWPWLTSEFWYDSYSPRCKFPHTVVELVLIGYKWIIYVHWLRCGAFTFHFFKIKDLEKICSVNSS